MFGATGERPHSISRIAHPITSEGLKEMVDFTQALNVKVEEIERPPLPPVGHYIFKVSKPAVFGDVGNGRFDTVDFPLQAVEAMDDVDPDQLSAVGGPTMINLRNRFMFNKGESEEDKANANRTLFNLRNFLENHLGMDIEGMTLKEAIDQAVGQQCMANVQYRPDKDNPEIVYAELGRTAPIE